MSDRGIAGKSIKSYTFSCADCHQVATFYDRNGRSIDKATAEKWARQAGWVKSVDRRWRHRPCPARAKAQAAAAPAELVAPPAAGVH